MKISVGVKIFGVVVVLLILVGSAAWYNALTADKVLSLIVDVHDTYVPAYGNLARANLRSVEEGLFARRMVIAKLQSPDDKDGYARLKQQAAEKSQDADAELADAEYHRAQAVGASGALSAEETQRRKSAAVTAAAKVKVAGAQLAEAQARLARAAVRAPEDGIILTRNVEVGQTSMAGGEALFRLSKGGEVELRGQVAEQDLPLLKVGQLVNVRLTGTNQVYEGRVRLLGAVIDPQTRLGMARVSLTPDVNLRPGAFARAEVTVSNAERAVLPQTAVLNDDKGSYVLVVNARGKVERRAVRVTGMVPSGVTVAEGLNPKDQIVTSAGAFLQEGETVKPVMAAAGTS